ncbi:MAG: hypothetical protein LQ350_002333 [Teloschistes chrysophthalmus]|nr:MAG: hypothetical protein LQ350_002333 [Niorma chrysophthalma]
MADLSSLLNPAPTTDPDPHQYENRNPNHREDYARPKSIRPPPVETVTLSVQPSIKSPLDTLADAATSSGPILSPTNSNRFVNIGPYNQSTPQPNSRPSSSHFSPPPLSYDHPHPPAPTPPTFSAGLQQYHHPTSSEVRARRPSTATETLVDSLPPLRHALPDDSFTKSEQTDAHSHHGDSAISSLPHFDAANSIRQDQQTQNPVEVAQLTSEITQPLPEPSLAAEESIQQPGQGEVKTEITTSPQLPAPSIEASTEAMAKPKAKPNRKRPAPKKGTATTVKPAAKKRKVEASESVKDESSLARVSSPLSRRASKTPAPKKGKEEAETPQRSSSIAAEDAEDDDDGVFCICRKPDDHTWMIGCDGPCEDWFHGRCIDMTEKDGDLIEKYFCPNCTEAGQGQTLWKRMCRLDGCGRPARTSGPNPSKYCSNEHGVEYMKKKSSEKEQKKDTEKSTETQAVTPAPTKGRKTNNSFQDVSMNDVQLTSTPKIEPSQTPASKEGEEADSDETQTQLRDGVLLPKELKALVNGVKDVAEFHRLGEEPKSDAASAPDFHNNNSNQIPYTPLEVSFLATLNTRKDALRERKKMLDDRETLLTLVRERAKLLLEEIKKKELEEQPKKKESTKDICGFDNRLIWTDEEFDDWRKSPEGTKALEERKLGPPTIPKSNNAQQDLVAPLAENQRPANNNGTEKQEQQQVNGAASASEEFGAGVCQKKRCERHKKWFTLQQQEIAFSRDEARQGIRKVEAEEKEIRERAMVRWLEGAPSTVADDEVVGEGQGKEGEAVGVGMGMGEGDGGKVGVKEVVVEVETGEETKVEVEDRAETEVEGEGEEGKVNGM